MNKKTFFWTALIFFIFGSTFVYGAGLITVNLSVSKINPDIKEVIKITVYVDTGGSSGVPGTMVVTRFGDGIEARETCNNPAGCSYSYNHSYSSSGVKNVEVYAIHSAGNEDTKRVDVTVSAGVGSGSGSGPNDAENPLNYNTFGELFDRILTVIFYISIILLPFLIVVGLFLMLANSATPENIALGKKIILYSVVILGIIIMIRSMFAYFKGDLTFT